MAELDFDRSLPPIMPDHGQWFNDRVAELVAAADGDETFLQTALVDFPRSQSYFSTPRGYKGSEETNDPIYVFDPYDFSQRRIS